MSELSEIKQQLATMSEHIATTNTNLAVLTTHTEGIKQTIKELKDEREKHKDVFWKRINLQDLAIVKEREDRIDEDNKTNTEVKLMKTKLAIYTTMIAAAVSAALTWARTLLASKGP